MQFLTQADQAVSQIPHADGIYASLKARHPGEVCVLGLSNRIISSIRTSKAIPFRMAPLIFVSTVITHLFGGSAGREGAALQIGGSIGSSIGKVLKLDEKVQDLAFRKLIVSLCLYK